MENKELTLVAQEQLNKPIEWFKQNVKCCYNCKHWVKDRFLLGDYAYNFCNTKKDTMVAWDGYCDNYLGIAKEENLIRRKDNEV